VIGLYLDNTDIYYMVTEGFRSPMRKAPTPQAVYTALSNIILKLSDLGMIVMPNGGDVFVRKFVRAHPSVIRTVNQEGVLYQDKKRQSKEDTEYYTDYLDWCKKKGIYIRGIEYPKTKAQAVHAQLYYKKHGWQGIYISYHKDLRGD
jgi:endo-alpha-1,4-polygalactosaminidase (GH114 family)